MNNCEACQRLIELGEIGSVCEKCKDKFMEELDQLDKEYPGLLSGHEPPDTDEYFEEIEEIAEEEGERNGWLEWYASNPDYTGDHDFSMN